MIERSPIPLHKWLICAFLMIRSKGVSSLQLARDLVITQDSAWFMAHWLRSIRSECGMFFGMVEVDEVYLDGKNKNHHWAKKMQFDRAFMARGLPSASRTGRATALLIAPRVVSREFTREFARDPSSEW